MAKNTRFSSCNSLFFMSAKKPSQVAVTDKDVKRQRVGEIVLGQPLASPRVRASLVGGASSGEGAHPSARAVAAAAAAAQRGAACDLGTASGLAPRCAGARLAEVHAAFEMTAAQFAEQLRSAPLDKSAKQPEAVTSKALIKWEMGLARVPMRVYQLAERLHAQLLKELDTQKAAEAEPLQHVTQVYPRQESMTGPEFQAVVPKHVGGSGAASKSNRKDERLWSPYAAAKERVDLDDYLSRVRTLLDSQQDPHMAYDEEAALETLCALEYKPAVALGALDWAVAWRRPNAARLLELQGGARDGGRSSAVNATLWLHRLRTAARSRLHGPGECEALEAGLGRHGKDLAEVRRTHLQEKSVYEVIDLYYRAPGRYTECVSAVEEDRLPATAAVKEALL